MSKYTVHWTCPRCGVKNTAYDVEPPYGLFGRVLANCDIEVGGCDKDAVLDVRVNITATALKIEEPAAV
jgi:hypothetical protein